MKYAYACSDCGHEQDSMLRPCDQCGSIKVVTIEVLTAFFGESWKEALHPLAVKEEHQNKKADP